MSTNKKHIGYIFQHSKGKYYRELDMGGCWNRADAYVYTCAEAHRIARQRPGWGEKCDGKWIAVYE